MSKEFDSNGETSWRPAILPHQPLEVSVPLARRHRQSTPPPPAPPPRENLLSRKEERKGRAPPGCLGRKGEGRGGEDAVSLPSPPAQTATPTSSTVAAAGADRRPHVFTQPAHLLHARPHGRGGG